jgi:hypothetical protein
MTSKEGTITIGGREFRFVRPTIEAYIEILSHNYEKQFAALDFSKILVDGAEYRSFKALWVNFCNSIFERSFLWRMLRPIAYLPKPLRFDSIMMTEIGRVIQSFFVWQAVALKEHEEPKETS